MPGGRPKTTGLSHNTKSKTYTSERVNVTSSSNKNSKNQSTLKRFFTSASGIPAKKTVNIFYF